MSGKEAGMVGSIVFFWGGFSTEIETWDFELGAASDGRVT